ncbi:putative mitochondrial protein [Tanacetum coccineum]
MTKISDVEANLEKFKSESLVSQEENLNRFDQMQESIDRNKVEADKQLAELLQHLKALQPTPTSISMPTTIMSLTTHTAALPPPLSHHATQPIPPNSQNPYPPFSVTSYPPFPGQPSAAYTSFSGLRFDSQGFLLPMTHAGEFSVNRNHCPPVSSEGIFQNYPGNTFRDAGGIFANTTVQPTTTVHGSERGWQPGSDHRLRKLKMPLFDGEDVYGWVYQVERFFEVQGLVTTGDRLRAVVLSLEGSALSWFRWINNREPFRSWEELKRRLLHRFQPSQNGGTIDQRGGTVLKPMPNRGGGGGISQPLGGIRRLRGCATGAMINSCPNINVQRRLYIYSSFLEGDKVRTKDDQENEDHFHLDSVEVSAQLVITGRRETRVIMGNGMSEKSYGICQKLELLLPRLTVTDDFYPLELGSTDVILGVKWLRQLGEVRVNWKRLTMTFQNGDNRVTLCGEPGLHRTEASLRSLARGISVNDQGYFVTLANLNGAELPESQVNPALDTLLTEFVDIFSMPIGLPPSRDHEHAIVLKEGTEPINVRPYRYPQLQKDEIEKLVGEMIESGIIRPSTSPFSSPVLLVKKKDGSWRFCVDYRALNKSTVLDKFPIPVIDELLDELHGATIFISCNAFWVNECTINVSISDEPGVSTIST